MRRLSKLGTLCAALLALTACSAQLGPRTIPASRFDYSEALARSWDEQLLLNLVRLRYRDTPLFLEVGSVVTHYSIGANVGTGAQVSVGDGTTRAYSLGPGGVAYTEEPTVTYGPLQGADFVARLLTPVAPSNLLLFSQSGWSVERLLLCCVQRVNNLRNAVGASGPTPDYVPTYESFQHLAQLLRKLQVAGLLEVELSSDQSFVLQLASAPDGTLAGEVAEVRKLLDLPEDVKTFRITSALKRKQPDEIAVTGRSLLAVLFYLSQAVEVPEKHETEGRVTVTRTASGERFDWAAATGHLLQVHSAANDPANAAVKVHYRGYWYYISDTDLSSKTTFSLLTYLYSLKAGSHDLKEPVLTLGIQ
jgi:hypothetical protein